MAHGSQHDIPPPIIHSTSEGTAFACFFSTTTVTITTVTITTVISATVIATTAATVIRYHRRYCHRRHRR